VPAQVILGACRPQLAHAAMTAAPSIAALLPCNVVVRDTGDDTTVVEVIDPDAQLLVEVTGEPALREIADDVAAKLQAAIDSLSR